MALVHGVIAIVAVPFVFRKWRVTEMQSRSGKTNTSIL
jgi:hypothetical protein